MTTDQKEKRNDEYNKYVKRVTPTHCLSANMLKAFILGGIICTIGQLIVNTCTQYFGLSSDEASAWCSMILILISCVLTSLNLYAPLANWGGAGALVPITGFANGVCSSACEFQVEGQVFGIGCQIFRIAGPVILYGIFSSWVLGVMIGGIFLFFVFGYWNYKIAFHLPLVLGVGAIVLIGTALAFTLYLQGVSDIGSVKASMIACVEPVSATIISALWLKTKFTGIDIVGLIAILTAVLLLSKKDNSRVKTLSVE